MSVAPLACAGAARTGPAGSSNLIIDYYHRFPDVVARCVEDPAPCVEPARFSPGFALPDLDDVVREFFTVATARWHHLADFRGRCLRLLDLTGNPATGTTKTFASLLIVARAVEFIRRTGERVVIFSPTSANKGVALRDAVRRAITTGLVAPDRLQVIVLAPGSCRDKLRADHLSLDPDLRRLNPVLLYPGSRADHVKALSREFAASEAARDTRGHLWFTLDLRNYLVADTARAFFEHDIDPPGQATRPRLHAHAVSSAFGLLGYHEGRALLEAEGGAQPAHRPGSLLVQHLGAPDMVLSLRHGDFDDANVPRYRLDPMTGLYQQAGDPHFPARTFDPGEVLDGTFYTRRPTTSSIMDALVHRFGGTGIVVSLHECLDRYPLVRQWLEPAGPRLPRDVRSLREWSTVMALTGVLNAVERGLVPEEIDIVVHGSGSYTADDYQPLESGAITSVRTVEDIAAAVRAAGS